MDVIRVYGDDLEIDNLLGHIMDYGIDINWEGTRDYCDIEVNQRDIRDVLKMIDLKDMEYEIIEGISKDDVKKLVQEELNNMLKEQEAVGDLSVFSEEARRWVSIEIEYDGREFSVYDYTSDETIIGRDRKDFERKCKMFFGEADPPISYEIEWY